MTTSFAVTWDYRCPFARNAHEHLLVALEAGADWDVDFVPFSLNQAHVAEGDPDVWDDPSKHPALLASEVALVVRDRFPDAFHRVHMALFAARHDDARDIRQLEVLRDVVTEAGADADAVLAEVEGGGPREAYRKAHALAVERHKVFGVPTFIAGEQAVFVRLMHRPAGDAEVARTTIERVLDLVTGWPDLNEFKHTSLPR
ncbi:MAG TPA: DsbA family protein [Acidimicrobiales bacterium]|nr:DsbA family protein [Acidimicrobiales bacterium]